MPQHVTRVRGDGEKRLGSGWGGMFDWVVREAGWIDLVVLAQLDGREPVPTSNLARGFKYPSPHSVVPKAVRNPERFFCQAFNGTWRTGTSVMYR